MKKSTRLQSRRISSQLWRDDVELFQLVGKELYTPVVGDILDTLKCYHQFLPQPVQPIREEMVVVGRAMPVLIIDVHGPQKKPFGLMTQALDDLKAGEVYIAGGGDMRSAYWGELLTATAQARRTVARCWMVFIGIRPRCLGRIGRCSVGVDTPGFVGPDGGGGFSLFYRDRWRLD